MESESGVTFISHLTLPGGSSRLTPSTAAGHRKRVVQKGPVAEVVSGSSLRRSSKVNWALPSWDFWGAQESGGQRRPGRRNRGGCGTGQRLFVVRIVGEGDPYLMVLPTSASATV